MPTLTEIDSLKPYFLKSWDNIFLRHNSAKANASFWVVRLRIVENSSRTPAILTPAIVVPPKSLSKTRLNKLPIVIPWPGRNEFIKNCPYCGTTLIREPGEANHYCPNSKSCSPQITGRIQHFIQRDAMDISSLGEKTIAALYDAGFVENVSDLYELAADKIKLLE